MTNSSYRAIIFDLDGTLIDNHTSCVAAFNSLCRLFPQALDPKSEIQMEKIFRLFHLKRPAVSYRWFCKTYQWENAPSFAAFWALWLKLYMASITPFSDSIDTLKELRSRGYRIGMITNGDTHFQREKLKSSGLKEYLDHIIISGEIGIQKPDPRIYQISADVLGVDLSKCLFVGNTNSTDIAGAFNAGMDAMLVHNENNRLHAAYHAESVSALLDFL